MYMQCNKLWICVIKWLIFVSLIIQNHQGDWQASEWCQWGSFRLTGKQGEISEGSWYYPWGMEVPEEQSAEGEGQEGTHRSVNGCGLPHCPYYLGLIFLNPGPIINPPFS